MFFPPTTQLPPSSPPPIYGSHGVCLQESKCHAPWPPISLPLRNRHIRKNQHLWHLACDQRLKLRPHLHSGLSIFPSVQTLDPSDLLNCALQTSARSFFAPWYPKPPVLPHQGDPKWCAYPGLARHSGHNWACRPHVTSRQSAITNSVHEFSPRQQDHVILPRSDTLHYPFLVTTSRSVISAEITLLSVFLRRQLYRAFAAVPVRCSFNIWKIQYIRS